MTRTNANCVWFDVVSHLLQGAGYGFLFLKKWVIRICISVTQGGDIHFFLLNPTDRRTYTKGFPGFSQNESVDRYVEIRGERQFHQPQLRERMPLRNYYPL